jgi:hypothetical protein
VRIIFGGIIFDDLDAALGPRRTAARPGRVVLPTGLRADFDAFFPPRALFATVLAPFLSVRRVALLDRPAAFAECLLMAINIAANFDFAQSFLGQNARLFN